MHRCFVQVLYLVMLTRHIDGEAGLRLPRLVWLPQYAGALGSLHVATSLTSRHGLESWFFTVLSEALGQAQRVPSAHSAKLK
mmetsp:Transcript_7537/g.14315  ORF Transcript_7537/g.14315 Transcript_7537/m.14315 type:complete len:82 (+) Transcript_7537:205-450(+)